MEALGMYIFGGSQALGHMKAGWNIDRILEISDEMLEQNSYHFIRNYPNIPVVKLSEWNNDEYIESLKGKYDLLFGNPPCSGLSSINRNANVNNDINKHIYEVADMINKIEPKSFLIENAPTLIARGLPILKDISKKLSNKYRITIITDLAGNHNVPMFRKRTLVVGWNRNYFESMPIINCIVNNDYTVGKALSGLTGDSPDMVKIDLNDKYDFSRFYYLVKPGDPVVKTLCENYESIKDKLSEDEKVLVLRTKDKYDKGGSVWDKSPLRLDLNGRAPSITSVNRYIHPTENRDIYVRECARLMGYPDSFKFYNGSKVSTIQCVAQGVPVNFIEYISSEIMSQFKNKVYYKEDCDIMYIDQSSGIQKITTFSIDDFVKCKNIHKNDHTMEEVSLW